MQMENPFKRLGAVMALFACLLAGPISQAKAQGAPGIPAVALGYCQMTSLSASALLSACVRAAFTATGSGTVLTVSSVTGIIKIGDVVRGTGVTAGTTITAQLTGTTGVAGTYRTSAATTSSGASLTSGGVPTGANAAVISVTTQAIRWRDDGADPTTTIGMPVAAAASFTYYGALGNLRFIEVTSGAVLNIAFFRTQN